MTRVNAVNHKGWVVQMLTTDGWINALKTKVWDTREEAESAKDFWFSGLIDYRVYEELNEKT